MNSRAHAAASAQLNERLTTGGLRLTPQRQQVYEVLLDKRDHPTADEVFIRAKRKMPEISLATVYNCLDALVTCGLVKHVHTERGAGRYCPNMHEHCHFYCDACGGVFDVDASESEPPIPLPRGFKASRFDLSIHGFCPDCAAKRKA